MTSMESARLAEAERKIEVLHHWLSDVIQRLETDREINYWLAEIAALREFRKPTEKESRGEA